MSPARLLPDRQRRIGRRPPPRNITCHPVADTSGHGMSVTKCLWCSRAFAPRANGGSPAKFCSAAHRKAYHSAVRHWAEAEIAGGRLTVAQIRNDAACTLATAAASPARGSAIEDPAPVAPAERPGEAAELLSDLLDVLFGLRGDAWAAVAAAVPASFRNGSIATSGGPENQPRFPSGAR